MARQIRILNPLSLLFFKKVLVVGILFLLFSLVFARFAWTEWVDADSSGQESINISDNSGASFDASLCLDSSGNLHIAWFDETPGNRDIYYLKWNGTEWVDADGSGQESVNISSNNGDSYHLVLDLDSSGNPHIAWADNTLGMYDIYYLRWNGTEWVDADGSGQESINVSKSSGNSDWPSLCLDSSGNPHIAWMDSTPGMYDIYYLRWNGTAWVDADGSGQESINVSNSSGSSWFPSLCLDSLGNSYIAWSDEAPGHPDIYYPSDIYYLKWNGTEWVDADGSGQESINISNSNGISLHPSLCLDSLGNPHIAWHDTTPGMCDIYYLRWNGTEWVDADGSGQESINVSNSSESSAYLPSLCLDSSGNPHVAWEDVISGPYDIYYLRWNGTEWVDADGSGQESINISNNSKSSCRPSLRLDSSGNPHVAWEDLTPGNYEIYYLKWTRAEASALLKKYAPVLYLHENEQFYPWGIESMLDMAELWEKQVLESKKVEGMDPPIYPAKLSTDYNNKKYYLNLQEYSPLNPPPSEKWQNYKIVVYGRQYESFDHIVLQYWFFYPFNNWTINNHEGDWEMAQVVLDKHKDSIKLCLAWHRDGNWYSWDDVQRIEGTHPMVFVTLGGHGCWASSGKHNLGLKNALLYDETSENGKVLYPEIVSPLSIKGKKDDDKKLYELEPINNEMCWVDWLGKWGELLEPFKQDVGWSGPDSPANISYRKNVPKRWEDPIGWCNTLEKAGKPSFSHYIATALSSPLLDVALHAYLLDIAPHASDESTLHVGETETGEIEATIPGTYIYTPSYYSHDQKEWMWIDTSENLRFEMKARSSTESLHVKGGSEEISNLSFNTHQVETAGKFNFALNRYIKEKDEDVTVTYSNVQFTKNTIATVDVSPENPGYLMKIDLDGDGVIDEIREPDVIEGISTLDSVIVYPNPCYLNKGRKVKISSLPSGSKIYIYTVAGELVRTLEEDSGIAPWDCRNEVGEIVARGIYIYLITSNTDKKIGKIAIVK